MRFLDDLSGRQRLLAIVLLVVCISVMITMWTAGLAASIILSIILLVILYITKAVWLSDNYGTTMIRRASLGIITLIVGSYSVWSQAWQWSLVKAAFQVFNLSVPTALENLVASNNLPAIEVLVFSLAVIFIVNYFTRDKTALGKTVSAVDKEFPEKEYKVHLQGFCNVLRRNIQEANRESNWSEELFVPLDAEVEVQSPDGKKKRVTDLVTAIKRIELVAHS